MNRLSHHGLFDRNDQTEQQGWISFRIPQRERGHFEFLRKSALIVEGHDLPKPAGMRLKKAQTLARAVTMERRQIFKDIVPGHVSLNAELNGAAGEPDYQRSTDLIGSLQQDEIFEEAGSTLWPEFRTARNKAGLWLRMPEGFERQT